MFPSNNSSVVKVQCVNTTHVRTHTLSAVGQSNEEEGASCQLKEEDHVFCSEVTVCVYVCACVCVCGKQLLLTHTHTHINNKQGKVLS